MKWPALAAVVLSAPSFAHPGGNDPLRDSLRARIAVLEAGHGLAIGEDTLAASAGDLETFYRNRDFHSAWVLHGLPRPEAIQMLDAARRSFAEGLDPSDYHVSSIDSLLRIFRHKVYWRIPAPSSAPADLELLLSEAFFKLARHHLYGRVRRKSLGGRWHPETESEELPRFLQEILGGRGGVRESLMRLAPPQAEYGKLKYWLAHHRKLLAITAGGRADTALQARILRIKLGLDCWRWLPRDLGRRHVRVNIADYRLSALADGKEELAMRVVVGRDSDNTPVFSDRIAGLFLNPEWNVPDPIARKEILEQLRKDPAYLDRNGMELRESWSQDAGILRTDSIDWSGVSTEEFPYRIRQRPGPSNALGRIKFALNNPFNVYLHDTPAKEHFEREQRTFSHGCIRVEKPLELAAWLLSPDTAWSLERLSAAIGREKTAFIAVPGGGVPVYILYWTAFVDAAGGLQFRPDVYGWDRRWEKALRDREDGFRD